MSNIRIKIKDVNLFIDNDYKIQLRITQPKSEMVPYICTPTINPKEGALKPSNNLFEIIFNGAQEFTYDQKKIMFSLRKSINEVSKKTGVKKSDATIQLASLISLEKQLNKSKSLILMSMVKKGQSKDTQEQTR